MMRQLGSSARHKWQEPLTKNYNWIIRKIYINICSWCCRFMFKSRVESNYNKYKEQVCHLLWGLIINSQEVVRNPEIRQLHQIISNLWTIAVECDVRKLDIEDKTNACFMRNRTHHLTRETRTIYNDNQKQSARWSSLWLYGGSCDLLEGSWPDLICC